MTAAFTHEIRAEWQQDAHDDNVTSLYIGRFQAITIEFDDFTEWELWFRDSKVTEGMANTTAEARAKVENELRACLN